MKLTRSWAPITRCISKMSLKAFHLVFIVLSILLAVACAAWSFANHTAEAFGVGSVIVAVALVAYAFYFLRKSRNIIT
jgi:hypothetical protein